MGGVRSPIPHDVDLSWDAWAMVDAGLVLFGFGIYGWGSPEGSGVSAGLPDGHGFSEGYGYDFARQDGSGTGSAWEGDGPGSGFGDGNGFGYGDNFGDGSGRSRFEDVQTDVQNNDWKALMLILGVK